MNKYTAIGLLSAAAEGKRIIVLSPHARARRDAFDEMRTSAPDLEWRLTNGDQRVTLPSGGSIRFLSDNRGLRDRLRGTIADIVLVEDDYAGRTHSDEVRAVIATSPHGEIIRY
ncbi:hypothetical protein [Cryobacterium sp. Y11]|uniref:hypothetical protein n=1 Tax=Cryobacterium sp. Y11 TaxID=2045016 RepID=UPI000CE36B5A|nr:hypothetical protein [Cryobacterium sp. Y11]